MTQKLTATCTFTSEDVFNNLTNEIVYGLGFKNAELTIDDESTGYDGYMVGMELYDEIPAEVYYDLAFECASEGWEVRCWFLNDGADDYYYDLWDALKMASNDIDTFKRMFSPDEIIPILRCSNGRKITITPHGFYDMDMRPYMGLVDYDTPEEWDAAFSDLEGV